MPKPSISFNNKDEILNYERRLANEGKNTYWANKLHLPTHKKYEHTRNLQVLIEELGNLILLLAEGIRKV